jgi:hypothetical protein
MSNCRKLPNLPKFILPILPNPHNEYKGTKGTTRITKIINISKTPGTNHTIILLRNTGALRKIRFSGLTAI